MELLRREEEDKNNGEKGWGGFGVEKGGYLGGFPLIAGGFWVK